MFKRIIVVCAVLVGLSVYGYAWTEIMDTRVSSQTVKSVVISSKTFTILFSTSEVRIGVTTATASGFEINNYWIRNTTTTSVGVKLSPDSGRATTEWITLPAGDIYKETQYRGNKYGKLDAAQQGDVTIEIEMNYHKR